MRTYVCLSVCLLPPQRFHKFTLEVICWPVDTACSRLGSPFSRLAMFSRLLPGCLTPTCRQGRHNYICQTTCPGCPLFPGCPAAQCSLFSRLLPSRLFTPHYPLGSLLNIGLFLYSALTVPKRFGRITAV